MDIRGCVDIACDDVVRMQNEEWTRSNTETLLSTDKYKKSIVESMNSSLPQITRPTPFECVICREADTVHVKRTRPACPGEIYHANVFAYTKLS